MGAISENLFIKAMKRVSGDSMDGKLLFGVFALVLLAGAVFAASGWQRGAPDLKDGTMNATMRTAPLPHANHTQMADFENAVEAGDFQTAKRLHAEYGVGGPFFDKLNETTFVKYSQIRVMTKELMSELGMDVPKEYGGPGFPGSQNSTVRDGFQGMRADFGECRHHNHADAPAESGE